MNFKWNSLNWPNSREVRVKKIDVLCTFSSPRVNWTNLSSLGLYSQTLLTCNVQKMEKLISIYCLFVSLSRAWTNTEPYKSALFYCPSPWFTRFDWRKNVFCTHTGNFRCWSYLSENISQLQLIHNFFYWCFKWTKSWTMPGPNTR